MTYLGFLSEKKDFMGIQCKGKNEYNNNQFTKKEIDFEIDKAKTFEPKLKKFYFATTAQNDSKIQAYVRTKNIEHINKELFEVHLFSWETIVDLIDENKQTHDWYVKNQNFKSKKSVKLTFQNDEEEIVVNPKFIKTTTVFKQESNMHNPSSNKDIYGFRKYQKMIEVASLGVMYNNQVNLSFSKFYLKVHNTGNDPIEEYKVSFKLEGDIQELKDDNELGGLQLISKYIPNTYLWSDSMSGKITPKKSILVGEDSLSSEDIYIKPFPKESEIILKWKLISKDFKDEGILTIKVIPDLQIKTNEIHVNNPLKVGTTTSKIEDCIVDKE